MATIVLSHLTQVIYAGTKLVLKSSKNPVILNGISFIPIGYRKGAKTKEGFKIGNNIYENAKENQKLVLFYGYSVINKTLIPTVIVVNGKNPNLRVELVNSYEEMIDNAEFPQIWELTAEGIEKKRKTSLTSEEINKSFKAFKKLMKRK